MSVSVSCDNEMMIIDKLFISLACVYVCVFACAAVWGRRKEREREMEKESTWLTAQHTFNSKHTYIQCKKHKFSQTHNQTHRNKSQAHEDHHRSWYLWKPVLGSPPDRQTIHPSRHPHGSHFVSRCIPHHCFSLVSYTHGAPSPSWVAPSYFTSCKPHYTSGLLTGGHRKHSFSRILVKSCVRGWTIVILNTCNIILEVTPIY